jgi:hypothetical protein
LPLCHASVEGISELAHLNGELPQVITELFHGAPLPGIVWLTYMRAFR